MLTTRETPTPNFTTNLFSNSLTYAFTWILMLDVNERSIENNGETRNMFPHSIQKIQDDGSQT
jgi:hypothetical protein